MQSVPPARCSPPAPPWFRSRAHIYGYGRSLRPPQGTSIAPLRRAAFRQTLLEKFSGATPADDGRVRSGPHADAELEAGYPRPYVRTVCPVDCTTNELGERQARA